MLINSLTLLGGLIFLVIGAELFVANTSKLGSKLGLSDMFLGITVIALGTSVPEVFVSISSIVNNTPEIAIGNSIGSNIANIGLIFGVSCFFLSKSSLDINLRDVFLLILSVLLTGYILFDYKISNSESFILVAFFILFVLHLLRQKHEPTEDGSQESLSKIISLIIFSMVILVSGSELTVFGGTNLASILSVSNEIIGLTMIAIGTSLPELAASISALRQKKGNMVIGNIIGSNILNVVLIFPLIGFSTSFILDELIFKRDFLMVCIYTSIFVVFISLGDSKGLVKKILYPILGIIFVAWTIFYQTSLYLA